MIAAPTPADEFDRLERLHALALFNEGPEPVLDALVHCAATLTGCPVALLSMVDAQRQVFVAKVGTAMRQTPRDAAFCAYTILGHEMFEVNDASQDVRFHDSPMVNGTANVRFYAGMPVSAGGHQVGALCVMDHRPRQLQLGERLALQGLAATVSAWLGQRELARRVTETPAGNWIRQREPVQVSSNRAGGFHLALRTH